MDVSDIFIRYSLLDSNDPKAKVTLHNITDNIQDIPLNETNIPKTTDLKSWGIIAQLSPNNSLITGFIKDTLYSVESNTRSLLRSTIPDRRPWRERARRSAASKLLPEPFDIDLIQLC